MKGKKQVYLAGPMSGYAEHNFPLFNRVARCLRAAGYEVFNPAENKDGDVRQSRAFYMQLDIPAVVAAEALVVLSSWEQSRGACLEVWLALDMGKPVLAWIEQGDGAFELRPLTDLDLKSLPQFSGLPATIASGS